MSETNTPQPLPEINVDQPHRLAPAVIDVLNATENSPPGLVVRREGVYEFNGRNRAEVIGEHVLDSLRRSGQWSSQRRGQTIKPTTFTPDHLDGIAYGRHFAQVNANGNEGPYAMVDLTVRRLNPFAQMQLREHIETMEEDPESYATTSYVSSLPESVSMYAPIVARYRTFLRPRDTIVFRNGFSGLHVNTQADKLLSSHSFHSVDEQGNLLNVPRHSSVSVVDTK